MELQEVINRCPPENPPIDTLCGKSVFFVEKTETQIFIILEDEKPFALTAKMVKEVASRYQDASEKDKLNPLHYALGRWGDAPVGRHTPLVAALIHWLPPQKSARPQEH